MERYPGQSSRPSVSSSNRRTAEEPSARPVVSAPSERRKSESDNKKTNVKAFVILAVVLAILGAAWWMLGKFSAGLPGYIDTSKYQSVLLSNNNAFYGKISEMTTDHIVLKDVFYIQQPTATEGEDANKFELIKRGDELHGPYDSMLINRSQVIYVENLKDDGKVAQTIKSYQSSKQ